MAVAKDLITNVLRSSLLRFIKDASGDQLHLRHLLSGTVELGPHVALAEPAIQQVLLDIGFPASIEVLSAHADQIRVHIPWAKLLGQSTRLVMGELTVQVRIHNVEAMAQVFEAPAPPKAEAPPYGAAGTAFLVRQRERLEVMVQKRCSKPPEGVVRRLTLLETVIQGLRAHVNKLRLEIFRDVDGGESPPSTMPYLTMELNGFTISPCTTAKRPTLELAEARLAAHVDMAQSLMEPLTPYAFRRLFRLDSADAWVARRRDGALAPYAAARLPWRQKAAEELWCRVIRFGACCLRTNIYQASLRSRTRSLGAYIVEEGGALLGLERILDMEAPDDGLGHRRPALDVEMEASMALELAELGGHFFSGFGVTNDWRQKQLEQRLPAVVGLSGPSRSRPSMPNCMGPVPEDLEEVEPVKEAVNSFLREGLRHERRSSLERRGSLENAAANGAGPAAAAATHKGPQGHRWAWGEKLLISGWLTKRAKLRPFQDSWQARWCELSQLPQGRGILRYSAPSSSPGQPGGVHLKGEIHLVPKSGAKVTPFEDEVARLRPRQQAGFLDWSRSYASIVEEFQHGFALQTAIEGPHAGRVFFFATERDSETRRWVAALRNVLQEKPQTLEEFLGEGGEAPVRTLSKGSTCLDDKDVSEVATEDISEDDSACSFVSFEEELGAKSPPAFPPAFAGSGGGATGAGCAVNLSSVEAVEAMLGDVKQFQSTKLNLASMRVRIGFDSISNPLKGILDEKIPKQMTLHAFLGNLHLDLASQTTRRGAAVAPLARLIGTVPETSVEQLLQRRASWSTLSTSELTVGEVNIRRLELNRSIALGQRPDTSHIRIYFEERSTKEAGQSVVSKSGTCFSAALLQLFCCVDASALMTLQVFLAKLGKAFAPEIPTLNPDAAVVDGDPVAMIKAMAPVSLQFRLEGLEVEVPLPGMPLSGQGLRISIGQMQFSSLEALQHFANALSPQPSSP